MCDMGKAPYPTCYNPTMDPKWSKQNLLMNINRRAREQGMGQE